MKEHINQWRNDLYATGNFNHDELNELESHVMDEMENVEVSSLNEEEKLLIAQHRLGSAGLLKQAYQKKSLLSQTQLSWAMQILMAYFLLREVVVFLTYVSTNLITVMELKNTTLKYGLSLSLEAAGLVLLILFLKHIIKLNSSTTSHTRPNLIMAGVCGGMFLLRINYIYITGSPIVQYESIIVAQLFSYIPVVMAFTAMIILSLKGWKRSNTSIAH